MDIKARMAQVAQQDSGIGIILGSVPVAKVQDIPLDKLHGYVRHTFQVRKDTEYYRAMVESIRDNGVQTPLLVRPGQVPGEYEIIAGHTRYSAAKDVGLTSVPCIVKALDDTTADRLMVESNFQRENWLPSERARSYKVWLEAVKAQSGITQGKRTDLTLGTEYPKLNHSRDAAVEGRGISPKTLSIYIKLNDLASPLLDLVDAGRITVKAGYQLAFLDAEAQRVIYNVFSPGNGMMKEEAARDLRFLAEQQGRLNPNDVRDILRGSKNKEPKVKAVTFKVPMTPGMDAKTVKRIKDDEEFQAALAAWIEDYLKLREADENERQ